MPIIWRLMVSTMVASGNGSVSIAMDHTDWPSQQVCERTKQTVYGTPQENTVVGGVEVKFRIRAFCMPVDVPHEPPREPPREPPVMMHMIPPWMR